MKSEIFSGNVEKFPQLRFIKPVLMRHWRPLCLFTIQLDVFEPWEEPQSVESIQLRELPIERFRPRTFLL